MRLQAVLFVVLAVFSLPLSAARYVLSSSNWSRVQEAAVAAAGGVVHYAHGTGIAFATSDDPEFLARIAASGKFDGAAEDMVVQWQIPSDEGEAEAAAVTPADETFSAVQWAPGAVNAPAAWNAGYDGSGVRVAILDGGIHSTHVDLAPNLDLARSVSMVPGFAFNQDSGTFWHGTHVAGIVAAADNNVGTIGIAPGATLIGVKVLHGGLGSFEQLISGILYASDPIAEGGGGADIIHMSLATTFPKGDGFGPATGAGPLVSALAKAVNYAASRGVLVVSALGNFGMDLGRQRSVTVVPAESGSGVAVSATGPLGFGLGATNFRRPASYSNYGEGSVTVAGPGGNGSLASNAQCTLGGLTFACRSLDRVLSTDRGTNDATYSFQHGTSMATPAVSAVAALALQAHPGISLGALKTKLKSSADDEGPIGMDEFYGHGFVNAGKAVR